MRWLVCLSLLLPLSAQAASVLLVPVDDKARALAEELVDAFNAQKLTVKTASPGSPAVNCLQDAARETCLQLIGEKAKVIGVFVVSGAMKGAKGTVTLELLDEGKVLKKETTKVVKGRVKQLLRPTVARLLKLLPKEERSGPPDVAPKATVTETPREVEKPEPVADVPPPAPVTSPSPSPSLTPAPAATPAPSPLAVTAPAPVKKSSRAGAVVMTIVAVAAAGTAATFGGLGLADKSRLETAPGGVSPLSYSEAQALQQSANLDFTIALGAGIGAGVSGVVAGILWGVP